MGPRINPLMADATRLLSDSDIEALAAYIATMP
jgi:cytochrome c553